MGGYDSGLDVLHWPFVLLTNTYLLLNDRPACYTTVLGWIAAQVSICSAQCRGCEVFPNPKVYSFANSSTEGQFGRLTMFDAYSTGKHSRTRDSQMSNARLAKRSRSQDAEMI
jgi:hypothetical protein